MKKFNDQFPQLEQIIAKWQQTGLLQEYGNGSEMGYCLATCLETQRILNEQMEDVDNLSICMWKRNNIPLIIRLFRQCEAFKRNSFVNFFEDIAMPSMLSFKTKFNPNDTKGPNGQHSIDKEAKYSEEFSKGIGREIETAFRDRRNSEIIFRGFDILDDKTVVMHYA
jgi:hypothetical protein